MNQRKLTCFLSVCKQGSVTAAAEEVGIAQPALSKMVKQLEHDVGATLFERSSKGVTLTKSGALLKQEASELIRRFNEIKNAVKERNNQVAGSVILVMVPSLAPIFAARLYPKLLKEHPDLSLKIVDCPSHLAADMLRNKEADLAIIPNSAIDLPEAESIPLIEEELFFIYGKGTGKHPSKMKFADAAKKDLVLPLFSHDLRKRLEEEVRNRGIKLNVIFETGSINVINRLVVDGIANSIVPKSFWNHNLMADSIVARPITKPEIKRMQSVCWLPNGGNFSSTELVKETVISEANQLVKDGKISGTFVSS